MAKKKILETGCDVCGPPSGCRVEAVLSVDERGQMVLPKDVRERAGIQTGEKLALISSEKVGKVFRRCRIGAWYKRPYEVPRGNDRSSLTRKG